MFSKACKHGIKAIIYIATQSMEGRRVKIGDVAARAGSPEAYTAKILGTLTKHRIVNSHTGPYGGFDIDTRRMEEIYMSDIVNALDGDGLFKDCALGLSECSHDYPCPAHHRFVRVRAELKQMLETTSVYDLAMGLKSGKTVLKP